MRQIRLVAEHRSFEQSNQWYQGIFLAMKDLSSSADRRPQAPEAVALGVDLREPIMA